MGIGDKQRIEAERREKYARAIADFSSKGGWTEQRRAVDAVLALVDAEIEPLEEQIEEQAQRWAGQIGRIVGLENENKRLQHVIDDVVTQRNSAYRKRDDERAAKEGNIEALNAALAEVERLEAQIARDALEQPEPEYEYRLRIDGVVTASRFDTLEAAREWGSPIHRNKEIVRRVKATDWEVVE